MTVSNEDYKVPNMKSFDESDDSSELTDELNLSMMGELN